jgi:GNAT superfamily N-acetyltransferase
MPVPALTKDNAAFAAHEGIILRVCCQSQPEDARSGERAAPVTYAFSPEISNEDLNALFAAAWPDCMPSDFAPILCRSLAYVCAYAGKVLVGLVNLAWDGGIHAFLLDITVHPTWQRRGVGHELVLRAAAVARERGMHWLHVDYEPHLDGFYRGCGFRPTLAGLIELQHSSDETTDG